jgi:hypothetical protein
MTTSPYEISSQPGAFISIDVGAEPLAMLGSGALFKAAPDGRWTDMGLVVGGFSAGLPSYAFPSGQLWVIDQNDGFVGGMISYFSAAGEKIPTNAKAVQISTADDGETWALGAGGFPMRWDAPAQQWSPHDRSGGISQIAVPSAALQWGLVSQDDRTFIVQRTSSKPTWTKAAGPPAATTAGITQIATNAAGDLVCVTADHLVFQYIGEGSTWIQMGGGDLNDAQSICIRDPNNAWLIDTAGQATPLGPLVNPSAHSGLPQWDTEDVWDETKSTHLYLVNRAAQLAATCPDPAFQAFVAQQIQPMTGKDRAGLFRQGLCHGLYDADFKPAYNNPNWTGQPTYKSHFYDASTGKNYMGETTPTALTNGVSFLKQSVAHMQNGDGDLQQAGYFLGLALHYFTDLTQPMHAANYTYLDSVPFGYHTDFEVYTMSVQAALLPQPTVTGFQPGAVNDIATLYHTTAASFKASFFAPIIDAHEYFSWKVSPGKWQAAVSSLLPAILNDSVSATAQLLYLYMSEFIKRN